MGGRHAHEHTKKHQGMALLVVAASLLAGPMARADVVTDWNVKAGDIVVEGRLGPPPANRVLAIVHTAATKPSTPLPSATTGSRKLDAAPGASVDAASRKQTAPRCRSWSRRSRPRSTAPIRRHCALIPAAR